AATPVTPVQTRISPAHQRTADSIGKAVSGLLVTDTMRKVAAGQALSPKEQQMWENIDAAAKGQPDYYPLGKAKGQPEIKPTPKPEGQPEIKPIGTPEAPKVPSGGTTEAPVSPKGKEVENIFGARAKAQDNTAEANKAIQTDENLTPQQKKAGNILEQAVKEGTAVDIVHKRVVGEEEGETERHGVTRVDTGEDRALVKRIGSAPKQMTLSSKNQIPQVDVTD